jgi:murein DD-endopeptidase MepM/ murein hydrolase activator NlpD
MVSYIDVLMGSQNFSDFIDRASAVATIMQADQDILKQHEADKKSLEENQAKLEEELASVQTILADLDKMKIQLNAQRAEKDQLLASLEHQEEEIHEHKMELQEEAQLLAAQSAALQKAIALEQKRQEEEAAAAAATAAANNNAGSSNGGGGSTPAQPTAPVTSGAFTLPANGTFTSGFGVRGGGMHYGVDIANSAAGVPIWAAADGVVIQSYYSSSYGNVVFIAHSVNGQTYTTVSAHMETRYVSSGAVVKKGQTIGIMGNTGDSSGKHLHFELHRGEWNGSKSNAINPVGIVPMP